MMIPLETQTLYAETLERARLSELDRRFGHLAGSFGSKNVGSERFWYFRSSEGGQGRQEFYVGPDTEAVHTLMDRYQQEKTEDAPRRSQLNRMAAMLAQGGCMTIDAASARVVEALAAGGLFRLGGVLIGTHAYLAIGNLMGIRWSSAIRTQDMDFAAFRSMTLAVHQEESADVWGILDALNMGFLPTPGLNPRDPHTSYRIRGKELKVDLLTTASRRGPMDPVFLPRFKAAALPMPYMEFLLEGATEALVLSVNSATLVKVPHPARFGLHKLIVASERPIVEQTKVVKDIAQASELLSFLLELRPVELEWACSWMHERGLYRKVLAAAERHLSKDTDIVCWLRRCHTDK